MCCRKGERWRQNKIVHIKKVSQSNFGNFCAINSRLQILAGAGFLAVGVNAPQGPVVTVGVSDRHTACTVF